MTRRQRPPRRAAERGVAAIEMALILTVTLALFPFVIWFGRAFYEYNVLIKSTDQAARYLASLSPLEITTDSLWGRDLTTAKQMIGATTGAAQLSVVPGAIQVGCAPNPCGTPNSQPANIEISLLVVMYDDLLFGTTSGAMSVQVDLMVPYAAN